MGVGSGVHGSLGPPGGCTLQGHPLCHGLQVCLQDSWNLRVAPPALNTLKKKKIRPFSSYWLLLWGFFFFFLTKPCRGDAWHSLSFTTEQVSCSRAAGCRQFARGELTARGRRESVSALKLQVASSGGSYTTKLPPLLSSCTWKIRQHSKKLALWNEGPYSKDIGRRYNI